MYISGGHRQTLNSVCIIQIQIGVSDSGIRLCVSKECFVAINHLFAPGSKQIIRWFSIIIHITIKLSAETPGLSIM